MKIEKWRKEEIYTVAQSYETENELITLDAKLIFVNGVFQRCDYFPNRNPYDLITWDFMSRINTAIIAIIEEDYDISQLDFDVVLTETKEKK